MKNCLLTLSALAFGTVFASAQQETPAAPQQNTTAQPTATQNAPLPSVTPQSAATVEAVQKPAPTVDSSPAAEVKKAPTTPPAAPTAQESPQEALQRLLRDLPPDTDTSEILQKAQDILPNACSYSICESTQSVNGKGQKAVTLTLIGNDGKEIELTKTWDQPAPTDEPVAKLPDFSPESNPILQSFSDPLSESVIAQAEHLCDLLQSITNKETADAAAPKLQTLCKSLESDMTALRGRRLSPMTEGLLLLKYEDAMNAVLPKTDALITEIAAKNFYDSEALKAVAETFCN